MITADEKKAGHPSHISNWKPCAIPFAHRFDAARPHPWADELAEAAATETERFVKMLLTVSDGSRFGPHAVEEFFSIFNRTLIEKNQQRIRRIRLSQLA